jgi:hypothetical protein
MDQDNSLEVSYDEWRSFFMVYPAILESVTGDPNEMLRYWRGATVFYFLLSSNFSYSLFY